MTQQAFKASTIDASGGKHTSVQQAAKLRPCLIAA
jgi:hypothetical protein